MGDYRQRGVHRRRSARRYWCQRTEHTCQQRRQQQRYHLTYYIRHQGYRAKLCSTVFGNEDARQGVIGKTAAESHTVGKASVHHKPHHCGTSPRTEHGDYRQQGVAWIDGTQVALHIWVHTYAESHAEEQRTESHKAHVAVFYKLRNETGIPCQNAKNKESNDYQTALHLFPPVIFHNPHANEQQPTTVATEINNASTPRVGKALIICSLPPTSTPSRKSSSQIRYVMRRPCNVCTVSQAPAYLFRRTYPAAIPKNIKSITTNMRQR